MPNVLRFFRRAVALMLAVYFVMITLGVHPAPIVPLDEENLQMELALIADVHTEGNNLNRFKVNSTCFKNLEGGKESIDALVLLGDLTMNGQAGEYLFFYGMMERINPIKPYYLVIGNHDLDNDDAAERNKKRERSLNFLQSFVDTGTDQLYYSKVVNGYTLIFLAADQSDEGESGRVLSDEQLDWFEQQLDLAAETGKPVFVFNHFPYYYMGDGCRERYISLLNRYDNTFVIVGHMHYYTRTTTVPGEKETPEIWVPCVTMLDENNEPYEETGRGYLMEVYEDRVEFRGFNFYADEFFDWSASYALSPVSDDAPVPAVGMD